MSRHIDAALTSGTSPGARGTRIQLLGPGAVGRALLRRIAGSRHTLVAVTDSTGTIADRTGLDANAIAGWKKAGRSLSSHPSATGRTWIDAKDHASPDLVIDATSSISRTGWASALEAHVLESGKSLVLVAKSALSERAGAWLNDRYSGRIACNGVLGGTGHSLLRSLPALRESCTSLAIVGNASTTSIITSIENDGSFTDGVREAARLGYLEPDPELDLRGTDAAVKLAIVAGAVRNRVIDVRTIGCQDIRTLDPAALRQRKRDGFTTRLIARLAADGSTNVAYEAVPIDSVLAAPCGRVIYQYDVRGHDRVIYIGEGLGADATAAAAWLDVQSISRNTARATAFVGAGAL